MVTSREEESGVIVVGIREKSLIICETLKYRVEECLRERNKWSVASLTPLIGFPGSDVRISRFHYIRMTF